MKPFEKDFPQKDMSPRGNDNTSYQNDDINIFPFNRNPANRSPTTSSREFKDIDKNKYLKMPFKK